MIKKVIFLSMLVLSFSGYAQNQRDTTQLADVVLTYKVPVPIVSLPFQVVVISAAQMDFQNFQSTADVLSNSGSLFVQKSQQGGGSPSIRGFEASRVLLLVDGVRMNNLIFRAGHLQNVITVDESMLDNVGIFYGPASTLFGSDALGGAVSMTTKKAKFLDEVQNKWTGAVNMRYSTINQEQSIALNLNYASKKFAALTLVSFNDFGDLKMGKNKNHKEDFFGERPFFVATINSLDQLVANKDKYVQKNTAFKQYNLMQKLSYKTNLGFEHGLNLQFSTSTDIPRYDRLTETDPSTGLRHAQWYYGPQERVLGIYSLNKKKAFISSDLKLTVAFQNVKESRHNRRFGNYNLQSREEEVKMYSVAVDLTRKFKSGELFYGLESYYENLNSSAHSTNINTGSKNSISTRYPNGDNAMLRNEIYISYNDKIADNTFWNLGARVGNTALKSTIADNSFFSLPFSKIEQNNFTYSGTIGIVKNTSEHCALKANVSSGFRVPNIDDLAKVFESVQGTLIVPNSKLKPEKTVTADIGIVMQTNSKKIKFENTYFYTRMYNAIATSPFQYEGQSVILYDGTLSKVFANQNKGKAFITGLSTKFSAMVVSKVKVDANFNYNLGRIIEEGAPQAPLDHIAPFFGKIGILYANSRASIEAYLLYNGKKKRSDYSSSGEDNLQYAPVNGMPAWETYNVKTSVEVYHNATLFAGVENILDTQYRTFSSGINAPGRNIYGGFRYNF
ncbi:TonB-dependent receptor plug domain-containing protein [Flavobacterium sp. ZT3P35]|uniref:TonB-dependent receptor plug domain-containing protein n=1 Tax=Flavobacterium sp. ZT3P35 TaxID=3401727 RepID=UPI003AB0C580